MKKLLLATAVAALSVSTAYAATDVYGRVVADLRFEEDGDVTLDNGSTRLGVKGSKAMTPNLDAIYQLEWAVDLDDSGSTNFTSRDTFIGVQGSTFGTLKAGHLTTIDDAVNFTNPSDYWKAGVKTGGWDGNRAKNAVAYISPNFNGLTFMGMYKLADTGSGTEDASDVNANGTVGAGVIYAQGPLEAGLSYIDFNNYSQKNQLRVSGAYSITPQVKLSGLYQVADFEGNDKEKENAYIVAAEYDVANSPWAAYVQYDGVTSQGGTKDNDMSVVSVGGTYAFAEGLTGRVYAGTTDTKDNSDADKFGFGTGLTYQF